MASERIYLSNISKAWPIDRQRDVLARVQAGGKTVEYRDEVTRRGLQARDTALLTDRADMLRPTSRRSQETIYVAALAVLAWTARDLGAVLAAAAARNATVVSVAEGLTIPPDPHAAVMAQALDVWERGRLRAQTEGGRLAGVKVSAEKRRAATADGIAKVGADWGRPSSEVSTAELMARSGLTYKTLNDKLGPRKKAQRKWLRDQERALRRAILDDEPA